MKFKFHLWRPFVFLVGLSAAGLGCFGAFEFARKLEGDMTYLVMAAPLIAGTAALIPPFAEWSWRSGERIKACLWAMAFIPAAAVVFFAAAERVHSAKAGATAEQRALHKAADRARANLEQAQLAYQRADQAEAKFRGATRCNTACRSARETADLLRTRVSEAETALIKADGAATSESPLQAPVWLLPAALDIIAFMAIWTGLGGPWWTAKAPTQRSASSAPKKRRKKRRKQQAKVQPSSVVPLKVAASSPRT